MSRKRLGALALLASTFVMFALPGGSFGALDLRQSADELKQAGAKVQAGLQATVQKAGDKTAALAAKTKARLKASQQAAKTRATTSDPTHVPPMHGSNPHGQGTIGNVDLNPSNDRPLDANPNGGATNANTNGTLPFTGTDAVGIALAGLLMLAGGMLLRRREDLSTVR
jgi:LPXTG-motif cell wall-anchored protein